MAFPSAPGYGQFPNGNFSPVIYSKQVQLAFRKASTVEDITNSDYFGEIANMGDSVKIIKEPEVSVQAYARGTQITAQDLDDEDFTLVVDQANYYAFKIDDIEAAHSHVNFMQMASDRAAYRLRDNYDQDVLAYLSGYAQSAKHAAGDTARTTAPGTKAIASAGSDELLSTMKLSRPNFGNLTSAGSAGDSIPLAPRFPGATGASTTTVSPLTVIARMGRLLDQQFVDTQGRWLVVDPVFVEMLKDEDSRLLNGDFGGSGLQNGLILNNLHGFRIYVSNNTPKIGTGPGTSGTSAQSTNFGVIVAGHDSAVATAQQLTKTETYRDPDSFADIVRGMHLYGRKILRPEGIVTAKYNVA
jgi:P22 coat protein - gene protein 5.